MTKVLTLIVLLAVLTSCNNSATPVEHTKENNASIPRTLSDTLYREVMKGHDVGMAKIGELMRYQQLLRQKADSIGQTKTGDARKSVLDSVLEDLTQAEALMNQWMQEFEPDHAGSTEEEKISFYLSEKEKIDTVNARILRSIEKAKGIAE